MTRLEAMEIVTNPCDVHIFIGEHHGKFGFAICRGPGHNYKPLISTRDWPFQNKAEAADYIQALLQAAWDDMSQQLIDGNSLVGKVVNSENQPLTKMFVLNPKCFPKIQSQLTEKSVANTWELFAENDPLLQPEPIAA